MSVQNCWLSITHPHTRLLSIHRHPTIPTKLPSCRLRFHASRTTCHTHRHPCHPSMRGEKKCRSSREEEKEEEESGDVLNRDIIITIIWNVFGIRVAATSPFSTINRITRKANHPTTKAKEQLTRYARNGNAFRDSTLINLQSQANIISVVE